MIGRNGRGGVAALAAPWCRMIAVVALFAAGPAAAAAEALTFSVGEDRYTVPADGFLSVEEKEGLTFCLTPEVETALTAFTASHIDETVAIAIGGDNVFYLKIVKPYGGGCINWPLHPVMAKSYREMLTGEGPAL